MTATSKLQHHDFQSYLDELLLQSTENEINAFWKRMDELMSNLSMSEKNIFFQQLTQSMDKGYEINERLLSEIKLLKNHA